MVPRKVIALSIYAVATFEKFYNRNLKKSVLVKESTINFLSPDRLTGGVVQKVRNSFVKVTTRAQKVILFSVTNNGRALQRARYTVLKARKRQKIFTEYIRGLY